MEDNSIIDLYWNRDEQAILETDHKYGKLCFRIAENILKRKEDSEECVNDTYLKVWNSIPDDRPEHFSAYLCMIAKRLALSKYRYNTAEKRNAEASLPYEELSEIVSGKESCESEVMLAELGEAISRFLMTEKKLHRQIFVRRYWYYDSAETIAKAYHISTNTVWSVLSRSRSRLKIYLQKEGYDL